MKASLFSFVVYLIATNTYCQNLLTDDTTGKYVRPIGNTVNLFLFNFMDYTGYTGGDKQINIIADGNVSHFRMPNVNYRARLGIDAAVGNKRRRHGIGFAGDFRALGGDYIGGAKVSYAYQAVDKPNVQFRIGIMGGIELLKHDFSSATYGDMIDDRFGFIYVPMEPLRDDSTLFLSPRAAAGAWLRVYGFGFALNVDRIIPTKKGLSGSYSVPVRLAGLAYYQIPIKAVHIMPSISFLYYGGGYRVEGGISIYGKPEKGIFAGVFASTDKDVRVLAGYNVKSRFKIYAGVTFYFNGLASILPVYDGFGGINLNFPRYGK